MSLQDYFFIGLAQLLTSYNLITLWALWSLTDKYILGELIYDTWVFYDAKRILNNTNKLLCKKLKHNDADLLDFSVLHSILKMSGPFFIWH